MGSNEKLRSLVSQLHWQADYARNVGEEGEIGISQSWLKRIAMSLLPLSPPRIRRSP